MWRRSSAILPGPDEPVAENRDDLCNKNWSGHMRTSALFMSSGLILASFPALCVTIDGIEIPDTLTVANRGPALVLNGAGVREKLFLDIYIGALYLPTKSGDAQAILSGSGPVCVTMHFLYKKVSSKKITDAWEGGLTANHTVAEMQTLRPQLEKFNALFRTMHKGEVIRICYLPGTGTEVRINGEWRGNVEGEAFFHALLAIWLGAQPVSNDLKQGMLGID
jgi:hypothetical protein